MSLQKSMTVRFFIHSHTRRADSVALLDLGATENFMSLSFARWLKLPIQKLLQPRKLLNVDGTLNSAGDLTTFTDLVVCTGTKYTKMRFFLTNLGENRAIFGYPWFAAMQPKVDWAKGWIDELHLPIVIKVLPPPAQARTTTSIPDKVPHPYRQYHQVFD